MAYLLTEGPGAGALAVHGGDPDLVFCFRAVKSTCVAPRVTCWRRTGGVDVWTSTMFRTMQIVASPQLPGDEGGKWLLGWVTENRDCLGSHNKIP